MPARFLSLPVLAAVALLKMHALASDAEPLPKPEKYYLAVGVVSGAEPRQWVFTVLFPHRYVGVSTPDYLRKYIELTIPAHATLEWAPGCKRMGDEPLLSSPEDLEAFQAFLRERKINFVLVPSG